MERVHEEEKSIIKKLS